MLNNNFQKRNRTFSYCQMIFMLVFQYQYIHFVYCLIAVFKLFIHAAIKDVCIEIHLHVCHTLYKIRTQPLNPLNKLYLKF